MARVFLSYAGENLGLARKIHEWLVADGHETFLDHDLQTGIRVGEDWQQRLHQQLRWADAVVCVITSAYVSSTWCTAEVAIAQSRGCRLLPILAEPSVEHPLLRSVQHVAVATDDTAHARLTAALQWVNTVGPFGWPDNYSPYPGLRSFDTDQHQIYFGREGEAAELAALLRSPVERAAGALLVIVGPSGCGKSSLVRAGLMPLMKSDDEWWTVPAIVPGADPLAALTREITPSAREAGLPWSVADVRLRLVDRGLSETADEILLAAGRHRRRLLVVVDQLEEVVTLTALSRRRRFVEMLRPAISGPVRVVGTLRPEFLENVLADPELAALPIRVHPLRPLRRRALERVIDGPAELAGITIDDGLTARLVDDTDSGEALPLLAYTLAELADGVGRGGRLLNSRYEQLGGVQGALARQADLALTNAITKGRRTRNDVIGELLRMVTVDETGRPTRWRIRRQDLSEVAQKEVEEFVARRLLVTDNENGSIVIGAAHESFLSAWPPLTEAISATVTGLRARRTVESSAAEWADGGRPQALLWERGQLAACISSTGVHLEPSSRRRPGLLRSPQESPRTRSARTTAHRVDLSPLAQEFLRASIRRDRRRRRRGTAILSALLLLALTAAALALSQQRVAEARERLATARSLLTQAENNADPRIAIRLGAAAFRIDPSAESRARLVNLMLQTPFTRSLDAGTTVVTGLAIAPGGRLLASADLNGATMLWDFSNPDRMNRIGEPINAHAGTIFDLAFSPNGRMLAGANRNGTVVLWDLIDPAHPRQLGNLLSAHAGATYAVAFAPDGGILATIGADGKAILWNVADPTAPKRVGPLEVGETTKVVGLAFAPSGHTLATTSDAGVIIWDLADPVLPQRLITNLPGLTDVVNVLSFSPDGRVLLTGVGTTTLLWDVTEMTNPRQIGEPVSGQDQAITDAAFSPTRHEFATASADGSALVWDIEDPVQPQQRHDVAFGPSRVILALAYSQDGRYLVTAGVDGTILVWDLTSPSHPREIGSIPSRRGGSATLEFSPDGRALAIAGSDEVALWDVADTSRPRQVATLSTGDRQIADIAFAPVGHLLAISGERTAALWDVTDITHPRRLGEPFLSSAHTVIGLAFAPDGNLLAIAHSDGTIVLWRITDPVIHLEQVGVPLHGPAQTNALAFEPDGHVLAVAGASGTNLWDVSDGAHPLELGVLGGHANPVVDVAFASDHNILATASGDRTTILWDLTDIPKPRRLGDPLLGHSGTVNAVEFSPDSQLLATVSEDDTLILWDRTDSVQLYQLGDPLSGHGAGLRRVAFSPDSRTVAVGSGDGSAILWDLQGLNAVRADPLKQACEMAGRGLDPTEWSRYARDTAYVESCDR